MHLILVAVCYKIKLPKHNGRKENKDKYSICSNFFSLLYYSLAFHSFGVALFIYVCINLGASKHCQTISKVILSVNMSNVFVFCKAFCDIFVKNYVRELLVHCMFWSLETGGANLVTGTLDCLCCDSTLFAGHSTSGSSFSQVLSISRWFLC